MYVETTKPYGTRPLRVPRSAHTQDYCTCYLIHLAAVRLVVVSPSASGGGCGRGEWSAVVCLLKDHTQSKLHPHMILMPGSIEALKLRVCLLSGLLVQVLWCTTSSCANTRGFSVFWKYEARRVRCWSNTQRKPGSAFGRRLHMNNVLKTFNYYMQLQQQ